MSDGNYKGVVVVAQFFIVGDVVIATFKMFHRAIFRISLSYREGV